MTIGLASIGASSVLAAPLMGVASGVSGMIGSLFQPASYRIARQAWHDDPAAIPAPEQLLYMWQRGILDTDTAIKYLRHWGVEFRDDKELRQLWSTVAWATRPLPNVNEALQGWAMGLLDDGGRDNMLRLAGADPRMWQWVGQQMISWPGLPMIHEAANRYFRTDVPPQVTITAGDLQTLFDRAKLPDGKLRDIMWAMRRQLPQPSDIVRFMIKDVFNPEIVSAFGLDKEFEEHKDALAIAERLGIEWPLAEEMPIKDKTLTYMRLLYRASWQELSPTQSYEFLHRFRAGRLRHWGIPDSTAPGGFRYPSLFDVDTAGKVLKQADYPQGVRDWLLAASYGVPRLVDLRNALELKVIDRVEFKDQMLDRGLSADDAEMSTKLIEEQIKRKFKPFEVLSASEIREAWSQGLISDAQAVDRLAVLLHDDRDRALAAFQRIKERDRLQFGKLAIAAVRRRVMSGVIPLSAARGELQGLGVQGPRIGQLMLLWELDLSTRRKHIAAGKIKTLACEGIITVAEARQRLSNLGYLNEDIFPLVVEIVSCQEKSARKRGRGESFKRFTPTQLSRFVGRCHMDLTAAIREMVRQGWSRDDAEIWFRAMVGEPECPAPPKAG